MNKRFNLHKVGDFWEVFDSSTMTTVFVSESQVKVVNIMKSVNNGNYSVLSANTK